MNAHLYLFIFSPAKEYQIRHLLQTAEVECYVPKSESEILKN